MRRFIRIYDYLMYVFVTVILIYVYKHFQTEYPLLYYPILPILLIILIDKLPIMYRCLGHRRFYLAFTLMAILLPITLLLLIAAFSVAYDRWQPYVLLSIVTILTLWVKLKHSSEVRDTAVYTEKCKRQFWVIYTISTLFFLIVFSPTILLVISFLVKLYHHLTSI